MAGIVLALVCLCAFVVATVATVATNWPVASVFLLWGIVTHYMWRRQVEVEKKVKIEGWHNPIPAS